MAPPKSRWIVLVAVVLAFLPIVVDMTVLHIAVPSLTLALGASGTQVLWIIDIYPLIMGGLLVPMGTLADRIGHRKMLLRGLSVFGIASVCAAFSRTPEMLIASRLFLAVGGSMTLPSVLATIRQTFEDEKERALALGVWSTMASAGAAIGPLVGGFLLEHFWWGSVFLINVPIMLVVLPAVYILIPNRKMADSVPWDFRQALLLIAGMIITVYSVKYGFKPGSPALISAVSFIAGIGLLVFFWRLQLVAKTPMLDLALLTKPVMLVGIVMAFVVIGSLAGFELLLAQELQYVLGRTPLQAGLFMMPLVVSSAVAGPFAGMLAGKFGLRNVATLAMVSAATALFLLAQMDFSRDRLLVGAIMALLGFSLGTGLLASSVAIMGSAPPEKAGAAGSLESTGYELGAGIGITFFGVLLGMIYRTGFTIPEDVLAQFPISAMNSMGETIMAARQLGGIQGEHIMVAAKQAFSGAHRTVLTVTSCLIGMLSVAVFVTLGRAGQGMKKNH